MLCPLCRNELFYDHMMMAWYCGDCKKYFHFDEKEKTLKLTGSNKKFMLC